MRAAGVLDVLDVEFGACVPRAERFAFSSFRLRLSSFACSLQTSDSTKPWSVSSPSQICCLLGMSDILRDRRAGFMSVLGDHARKRKKSDIPVDHLVDDIRVTKEWHHGQQFLKHSTEDLVLFSDRERGSQPAL